MNHLKHALKDDVVEVRNTQATSNIVVVCEHASAKIPAEFQNLGLQDKHLKSHVVWDPGAIALASRMATNLNAVLVASRTSRLVYDCNRPPGASDAIPARTEVSNVPGNAALSVDQTTERTAKFYEPFRTVLSDTLSGKSAPILVTVHSFTPVFRGQSRDVEIGILHDRDSRLADAVLSAAAQYLPFKIRRNEPYGPQDGVTHTLKEHALPNGHLNVMLEVRNDLIADETTQTKMADTLSALLSDVLQNVDLVACKN